MLMSSANEPGPDRSDQPDIGSALKGALNVLRRRFLLLAVITAAIFGMFVALLMMMTPRYTATARVRIDPKPVAANGSTQDLNTSLPDQSVVDTEVSVIKSRDIATAVVNALNLVHDPELSEGLDDPKHPVSPKVRSEVVIGRVLGRLSVDREKSTYLVDITFKSKSPTVAADVANAFATNYIKATVQRRTGTAEQQHAWLDRQLADLSAQARSADAALAQYQAANGITTGTATSGTITDQQIAPISNQLATAQAAAAAAHSDLSVAQQQMATRGAAAASSVLNSPAIASLRQNRATIQQELSQLATRYGPKHPQTIQAQQQLAAVDQQIADEAHRIIGELQARAHAADAQSSSLSGDLSRLRSQQASDARSAVAADALKRDADAKQNAYNRLADVTQQVDQLSQNSLSQAQIIEDAEPPLSPSSPKSKLILGAGLLIALTAGIGTITLLELLSSGFARTDEIERYLGINFLASVPLARTRGKNPADLLVARPMSAFAEAFRAIRSSLLLSSDQPPRVIAVVSTLPDEGKTTSALALARVMAMSGERTLLIDGDLRRSGLSRLVPNGSTLGLLEVLRGTASVERAVFRDEIDNLDIMASLPRDIETVDVFGSEAMRRLLGDLRGRYDHVIIDTPPLLGVAHARTIAASADAVVLIVKWNASPRNAVKSSVRMLHLDHAKIAGAVLTMVNPKSEALGGLYYSRALASYYQNA